MSIELTIDHSKIDAQEAITQFAARRGYQLSHPWYLDGLRIEDISRTGENLPTKSGTGRGFWASLGAFFSVPAPGPRIDLELKRRRGRTVVKMSLGGHQDSVHLAYGLRAYLSDNRAFTCECPPLCPACAAVVWNYSANYCGQCGHVFVSRPLIPMKARSNHEKASATELASEPARARDAAKQSDHAPRKAAESEKRVIDLNEQSTRSASADTVKIEPENRKVPDAAFEPASESLASRVQGGPDSRLEADSEVETEPNESQENNRAKAGAPDDDSVTGRHSSMSKLAENRPVRPQGQRILAED